MSYFKFKKEARKNTPTRSKEDPEDQKISRELEAEAWRLASLLGDPEIKKVLNAYSSYLDCTCLYSDACLAAVDLRTTLIAIFENEAFKEDGDTRLAIMAKEELDWVTDVMNKLHEVYARVKAGTFPITDANKLFIKTYRKFKEVEHYVKSEVLS